MIDIITGYLVPFLVLLTVLVFVHELGHYLVARWAGVRVEVFSIGFGPVLVSRHDRHGTRWQIAAIPLGGYVKMFGDLDVASARADGTLARMSDEERRVAFPAQPVARRAAIVAAGPIANFLFAIVVLAGLFMVAGQRISPATVDMVTESSVAAEAGLQQGDRIVSVDGTPIERFETLARMIRERPGIPVVLGVERDGRGFELDITPEVVEYENRFGGTVREGRLGVGNSSGEMVRHGPVDAVVEAVHETVFFVRSMLAAIGEIITGTRGTDELRGPLGIAQISGEAAQIGVATAIWFTAVLSINLGLINLFPIPVLDGGHLVLYAAEALRGRPVSERVQEVASMVGLALILCLMVLVTWNDLVSLKVVDYIGSIVS